MFAARYFASRYFANRYFPAVGETTTQVIWRALTGLSSMSGGSITLEVEG